MLFRIAALVILLVGLGIAYLLDQPSSTPTNAYSAPAGTPSKGNGDANF